MSTKRGLLRSDRLFVALLIFVALAKGTVYSAVTPPWQAPDEPKHFEYVSLLHEKGRLISPDDRSPSLEQKIIHSLAQFDYWAYWVQPAAASPPSSFEEIWSHSGSALGAPPLPFLFGLPAFALVSHADIATQLYVMRLTNVLLGVVVVVLAFLVAREIFPGDNLMIRAVPAFLLFIPMYSFIAGSYGNEPMADVAAAVWLYAMVLIVKRGFSAHRATFLVGALLMAYLSKRTSLFLIPLSAICVPLAMVRGKGAGRAAAASLVGIVAMASLFVFMASLPQGSLRWALLDRYFWGTFGYSLRGLTTHDYFSYAYLDLLVRYFQVIFESFWGVFGWMNIRVDDVWYWALGGLALAAGVGVALLVTSPPDKRLPWQRHAYILLLATILFALGPIIAQYSSDFNPRAVPQGRYLFPAVIPISILMVSGLRRIMPKGREASFTFALLSFMFLFDSASLVLYILPFYYG